MKQIFFLNKFLNFSDQICSPPNPPLCPQRFFLVSYKCISFQEFIRLFKPKRNILRVSLQKKSTKRPPGVVVFFWMMPQYVSALCRSSFDFWRPEKKLPLQFFYNGSRNVVFFVGAFDPNPYTRFSCVEFSFSFSVRQYSARRVGPHSGPLLGHITNPLPHWRYSSPPAGRDQQIFLRNCFLV